MCVVSCRLCDVEPAKSASELLSNRTFTFFLFGLQLQFVSEKHLSELEAMTGGVESLVKVEALLVQLQDFEARSKVSNSISSSVSQSVSHSISLLVSQ